MSDKATKFFIDTEFIERGPNFPITLLSIGIVAEDGREFYAVNADADRSTASEWVKKNVLPHLGQRRPESLENIRARIIGFVGNVKPEFWGYYADYDWVVFAQIFGTMMDLPEGWPMFCRDIKQLCMDKGNPELPKQNSTEHNALADAYWNKLAYEFLESQRTQDPSTLAPTFESWINEDELPKDYPYDAMFPFSKLGPDGRGGVRIFPKLPAGTQAPSEQAEEIAAWRSLVPGYEEPDRLLELMQANATAHLHALAEIEELKSLAGTQAQAAQPENKFRPIPDCRRALAESIEQIFWHGHVDSRTDSWEKRVNLIEATLDIYGKRLQGEVQAAQWISVNEDMPDINVPIFFWVYSEKQWHAGYLRSELLYETAMRFGDDFDTMFFDLCEISHWMMQSSLGAPVAALETQPLANNSLADMFEDMSDRWRSRYNSACERLNRLTRWRFFSRTELPEGMSERLDGEWVKFSEVVAALEGNGEKK